MFEHMTKISNYQRPYTYVYIQYTLAEECTPNFIVHEPISNEIALIPVKYVV